MADSLQKGITAVKEQYAGLTNLELLYVDLSSSGNREFIPPRCSFCNAISSNEAGELACINQREIFVMHALNEYASSINICPAGLVVWSAPVYYHKKLEGLFISGFAVSSNEDEVNILSQTKYYTKQYGISQTDVHRFYPIINRVEPWQISPLANALFAMVQALIPSGISSGEQLKPPQLKDVIPFSEQDDSTMFNDEKPFSYYAANTSMPIESLKVFWKTFETKTANIFINLMGGRIVNARSTYADIMQMAYRETSLDQIKISAVHIYHIMTMKFFSKDLFNVRMYGLMDETIKSLFNADSVNDIKNIMDLTFMRMCNLYNIEDNSDHIKSITNKVIHYLEKNYDKNIKIEDIAKNLYISPAYLSRAFKKETTFTIKWCLNNIRMQHAQDLLIHTTTPVNKIGPAVGYEDMRAFYKMFSKHFGITCSEMRNRYFSLHT